MQGVDLATHYTIVSSNHALKL